jgi:hypothetical protein
MIDKNPLTQIFESNAGKYSDKWESYLEIYWELFSSVSLMDSDLLEIGVQNGGSLEIWAKFFPNTKNIIGLDVHPNCEELVFKDPRIKVFVEDASDPKGAKLVQQTSSNLGVVIDDGSHMSSDVISSFLLFFPQLKPGGIYVIEDLHTSYWSDWQGGLSHPQSSMQFLKLLADVLNYDHWGIKARKIDLFKGIPVVRELGTEDTFSSIDSVMFMDSVCVVRKKVSSKKDLGPRIGSGSEAFVHPVVKTLVGQKSQTPVQERNQFAIMDDLNFVNQKKLVSQNQELVSQNQELLSQNQELVSQNQELRERIDNVVSSIDSMRNTISWRVTTPLRYLRVLLSKLFDQSQ